MKRPRQFNIYKGIKGNYGAIQFQLQGPHYFCPDCKARNYKDSYQLEECKKLGHNPDLQSREGAIFVEATSASGPNKYDWEQKIRMAFSINDCGQVLNFCETPGKNLQLSLTHDPHAKSSKAGQITKRLDLSSPQGIREKGMLITLTQTTKTGEEAKTTKHTIPVSPPEVKTLVVLLRAAIPSMLDWT